MANDHYCTSTNVNQIYGTTNVQMWADLDDDGNTTNIAARITTFIGMVAADMDAKFRRTHYEIPIVAQDGTVPSEVRYLCARLVGPAMYEARGVQDYDPETGKLVNRLAFAKETAEAYLEEIATQKRKLDAK